MSWTDERVETLKKMWSEGQSASQIAKELGGVTRNAVIGKVHRLGLSNRASGGKSEAKAKPAAKSEAKPRASRANSAMTTLFPAPVGKTRHAGASVVRKCSTVRRTACSW